MIILKFGDKGQEVQDLQEALKRKGYQLSADGDFGKVTLAAVKDFQKKKGILVDGKVGNGTWGHLLEGAPVKPAEAKSASTSAKKALTEDAVKAAARKLGLTAAHIKTVWTVESKGNGFHSNGSVVCLFERHQFYKHVVKYQGKEAAEKLRASNPDICNPNRGGYKGGLAENKRLANARALNDRAALMSASYGRFQIMGFNFKAAGFPDVHSFYSAMCESEDRQLDALCAFIAANPAMLQALKHKDWATFARLYNGKDYKSNNYDYKLASAWRSFGGK